MKKYLIFFSAFFLTVYSVYAEIYTWSDEHGKVYFSDKSVTHYGATKLKIKVQKDLGGDTRFARNNRSGVIIYTSDIGDIPRVYRITALEETIEELKLLIEFYDLPNEKGPYIITASSDSIYSQSLMSGVKIEDNLKRSVIVVSQLTNKADRYTETKVLDIIINRYTGQKYKDTPIRFQLGFKKEWFKN